MKTQKRRRSDENTTTKSIGRSPGNGLFFIVIGGLFVYMGNDAKNMITDELVTQNITLGADAVEFGGTPGDAIRDARIADIENKIITLHAEGKHGVWSAQDRKTEE